MTADGAPGPALATGRRDPVTAGIADQLDEVSGLVRFLDARHAQVADRSLRSAPGQLVEEVAEHLYGDWYLQRSLPPALHGPIRPAELDLVAALRSAHAGGEVFEGGWSAQRVSTLGRVEARRGDHVRVLDRCDYVVPARPGLRAEPGDELLVAARDEHLEAGGFWLSHLGDWPPSSSLLTRLYWRVDLAGAAGLVRRLTAVMASAGTPAAIKVTAVAETFGRADAAVLYLPRPAFPVLASQLRATAAALAAHLVDPPPRLTRRLAAGVGAADGPVEGASFGVSRCRLIADALYQAHQAGQATAGERVAVIRARLIAAGLNPDRPYLAPGADEQYAW